MVVIVTVVTVVVREKTTKLTPPQQCDVFRAAFRNLAMFFFFIYLGYTNVCMGSSKIKVVTCDQQVKVANSPKVSLKNIARSRKAALNTSH